MKLIRFIEGPILILAFFAEGLFLLLAFFISLIFFSGDGDLEEFNDCC